MAKNEKKKKEYTCKEIEHMIPDFLHQNLKGKVLMQFLEHTKQCESCKEELTIQYLTQEGVARLEEGKTFHLDKELEEYMHAMLRKHKIWQSLRVGLILLEVLAILVIGVIFAYAWL